MSSQVPDHPPLWRPSLFAVVWHACTWIGWAVIVVSVVALAPSDLQGMGEPLVMIVAIVVFSELRPIVMTRLTGNPVSISLAFVFATMYLWGLYAAVLLYAGSIVLSEILQRKPLWKLLFNTGQYICSLGAAWLVLLAAGVVPSPTSPGMQMTAKDLGWIAASWIVYHLVNLALVAGLADEGTTWWEDFSDEFWFYTVATLAVLALSPLIAIVAVAYPYSWTLLPLLLLPLLAVQKAAEMSRHQEHQSLHDPLTGLPNRVLLNDRIEQALARSSRMRGMVVVMFLDLDLFKVVNDSLGHHAGDELLIDVAGRLKSAVRSGDTLARFGGDEFVVMCEDVTEDEVNAIAERITSSLRQSFLSDDRDVTVTASLGVAVATPKSTPQTLLRDADVAMYRAKEHGRNQVVMFDEAMHQQANERLLDAVGLRRALEHGEFRVVYQPVLDIATGRTIGMEALIRWDDPERGLVSPAMFIPAAEETGLIAPIGEWVLDAALADARMWRDQYGLTDMWVAVNISSRQLLSPTLADDVERALLTSGVPASSLQLEITESAVMNDLEPVLDVLGRLRELGVSLAVDDFGTGYSSLAYLKRLPVTTLKIDRAFISGLGGIDDAFDRPIVDAILKMAQSLGLDVIAEGVETQDQRDALAELGGQLAQGFLWARPMPPADAVEWVRHHTSLGKL